MSNSKRVGIDLTSGNIFYQLMIFVLPLLLTNFVQQMYNTVDMVVIGQFVGSAGANGVSNGGEIATLITFFATAFGSAGQIYVSQLFGAKNYKAVNETLSTAMIMMAIMSLVATVFCILFCDQLLSWLNCPQESLSNARSYMLVVSLGLPAVFGYNMICSILRGMGEAKRPLLFISVAAVSNVVMDILLVAVFSMGALGTAIATIIAQYASLGMAALFLYNKREQFDLHLSRHSLRMNKAHLAALMRLGIPMAAQSSLIHFSLLICSAQINTFGLVSSTTNSIGNLVTKLVNIFSSSVTQGSGAMVGQNIGAKKYDRVKLIVRDTLICTLVCSTLASALILLFPRQIYGLFLKSSDVNYTAILDLGVIYLRYCVVVFMFSAIQGAYQSVLTGSGNAKLGMIAGLLDGVFLRLGFSFLLAYTCGMGVQGFFLANGLARLGPILVGSVYYYSGKWQSFDLLKNIESQNAERKLEVS